MTIEEDLSVNVYSEDVKVEVEREVRKAWLDPKSITLNAGTQTRRPSQAKIEEYAEMMKNDAWSWANSSPIVVFDDGNNLFPVDGHHRIQAAILAKQKSISVEIYQGTLRDAIWESFASNKMHGLSLSNEDKRERVKAIINDSEWQIISDRQIAEHCGVSAPFVGKIRTELSASGTVPITLERKGKDGRVVNVDKIGKKAEVKIDNIEPDILDVNEPVRATVEASVYNLSDRASRNGLAIAEIQIATKSLEAWILDLVQEFGAKPLVEAALDECEIEDVRAIVSNLSSEIAALDQQEKNG